MCLLVTKVNMNTIPISKTLPEASQNSLSPYHRTAKILRSPYSKVQAMQTAHEGMSSRQKVKTRLNADISKGIKQSSYSTKFQPSMNPKASSTQREPIRT